MKYVFRFIGFLVVVLLIAALALYTLNSFGYLHGPLSKWINDVANHCQGTVNDTVDFAANARPRALVRRTLISPLDKTETEWYDTFGLENIWV